MLLVVLTRYVGKRLTGNLSGWRYRVGDYRVICRFRDSVITVDVVAIRHRSKAYEVYKH